MTSLFTLSSIGTRQPAYGGHNGAIPRRRRAAFAAVFMIVSVALCSMMTGPSGTAFGSTALLIGSGSSAAGPEILQWTADTAKNPYNVTVDYTSTSSGDGRFNFGNNTVDFAVSDIPYQGLAFDTKQPNFPFIYVPIAAEGVAFMYHLNGLSSPLQLSSYSACAIMTGGVRRGGTTR